VNTVPAWRGTRAILVYLGLPAVLFLLFYVRWNIGLPVLALLLVATWQVLVGARDAAPRWQPWLPALAGSAVIAWLIGFPHGPYPWDWVKHWALLGELSRHPWPLVLDFEGVPHYLRYYLGAYLVPALFHRSVPQLALWLPTLLWFGVGFTLVMRAVASIAPRPSRQWLAIGLLLILGGADFYAQLAYRGWQGYPTPMPTMLALHQESWLYNAQALPLEYSSFLTALVWVPHQAIATFLATLLIVVPAQRHALAAALLGFGLLALWSPYGMIGLLPLLLVLLVRQRAALLERATLLAGGAAVTFAFIVAWYLTTDAPTGGACFACAPARLLKYYRVVPFVVVELLPFALLLGSRLWTDVICRTALITLLFIPLTFGEAGDSVMRASLGPLFVLGVRAIAALLADWELRRRLVAQVAALVLCLPGAVSETVYLQTAARAHRAFPVTDPLRAPWMVEFGTTDQVTAVDYFNFCGWKFLPQYFTARRPAMLRDPAIEKND
jgi:hypothetical protein